MIILAVAALTATVLGCATAVAVHDARTDTGHPDDWGRR